MSKTADFEASLKAMAVLIDADNASPRIVEPLLAEIAKYGVASVKRIYGDWTQPRLNGWKEVLLSHAIHPVQQFGYTTGKNATDSAMIIDAMDLMYSNRFGGFCIVSSDSDFTRLASRLREAGLMVLGFGEKKTPNSFVSACDKFLYTEVICEDESQPATAGKQRKKSGGATAVKNDKKLHRMLRDALDAIAGDDGWAQLGGVGQQIVNQYPSFDSRNWGYRKLGDLVRAVGIFEIEDKAVDGSPRHSVIYIRDKSGS